MRPLDEIFGVEVGIKGLGEDVQIDVIVVQHVEQGKLTQSGHANYYKAKDGSIIDNDNEVMLMLLVNHSASLLY